MNIRSFTPLEIYQIPILNKIALLLDYYEPVKKNLTLQIYHNNFHLQIFFKKNLFNSKIIRIFVQHF
jgi:hypothetical protein